MNALRLPAGEFLGTFFLALAAGAVTFAGTSGSYPIAAVGAPLAMGLALAFIILLLTASGAGRFNPALSLGRLLFGGGTPGTTAGELTAQLLGAAAGLWVMRHLAAGSEASFAPSGPYPALAEFLGSLLLALAAAAAARAKAQAAPYVGGALFLGLAVAGQVGAGLFNPALALAFFGFDSQYLVAYALVPLLGGAAGYALGTLLLPEA